MQLRAWAKISLALDVLGHRADDGYHDVDIVLHRIPLADRIQIEPSGSLDVVIHGMPSDPDNLLVQALRLLQALLGPLPPVRIRLDKEIPVAAGMGGGSADAACLLRWAMSRFPERAHDIQALAPKLGMDVPFLMGGMAARAQGRGEQMTPLPAMRDCWLVLANPGFALSTASVYAAYDKVGSQEEPMASRVVDALRDGVLPWELGNQLESAAFAVQPNLNDFRRHLERLGAPPRRMVLSGSGATYAVLLEQEKTAVSLWRRFKEHGVSWTKVLALSAEEDRDASADPGGTA